MEIPFTQSKYIFSYDVEVKAGFDFTQIEWSLNDHTIEVKLQETNARANAETILTGLFASAYDMDEYEIVFTDK